MSRSLINFTVCIQKNKLLCALKTRSIFISFQRRDELSSARNSSLTYYFAVKLQPKYNYKYKKENNNEQI